MEALALCRTATVVAPEVGLGWYNLGLVSRRSGDLVGALEAYGQARRLNPDHAETHQNLAVAELLAGDIAASRASFRQAIALLSRQGRAGEAAHLRQQAGAMVQLEP